jgi:hypothetical protein
MKMTVKSKLCLSALATVLVSGCTVTVRPDPVVVAPPPPGPVVEVAPPFYVWDGYEYVGEVNGGFFYLGAGGVWLTCDAVRLERWHGWERGHPDWRRSAIRYDRGHRPDYRGRGERREERH